MLLSDAMIIPLNQSNPFWNESGKGYMPLSVMWLHMKMEQKTVTLTVSEICSRLIMKICRYYIRKC